MLTDCSNAAQQLVLIFHLACAASLTYPIFQDFNAFHSANSICRRQTCHLHPFSANPSERALTICCFSRQLIVSQAGSKASVRNRGLWSLPINLSSTSAQSFEVLNTLRQHSTRLPCSLWAKFIHGAFFSPSTNEAGASSTRR